MADDFNTKVGRVLSRGAYEVRSHTLATSTQSDYTSRFCKENFSNLQGQLHKSSMYASSIAPQGPGIATTMGLFGGTPELNTATQALATSIGAAQGPSQYTWV